MKKKIIAFSILAGLTFSSCEKLVEVEPQNSLSESTALSDVKSYEAVLVSVYDRVQAFTYWGRDMALLGDALSDNIYTVPSQASGRYTGANNNIRGSHFSTALWSNAYAAINECNTILESIDALVVPASQEALKKQVKAETLALRAMLYFDLARVYGYEPNKIVDGFNKSAVLRLTPTKSPAQATLKGRATVEEVYTQIEADLKASLEIIGGTSRYRMNKGAAHALLGKVYLYWEKWALANEQFDLAMANTTATLTNNYVAAFRAVPNPESLFEINFVQATEYAGVLGVNDSPFSYTQPNGRNALGVSTYGGQTPSAELLALFEESDSRKAMFFTSASSTSSGVTYTWSNKYSSANGPYVDNIKVIRYADVLLMKAEALANLERYEESRLLVERLRVARNASVDIIPGDASLKNFIQDERRRELFFEGHRWFDLKRLGNAVTKPAVTAVGTVNDYRILAPLPNAEVLLNPELPQNPNY